MSQHIAHILHGTDVQRKQQRADFSCHFLSHIVVVQTGIS